MNAILDTHTFLWWNIDDPRLSKQAKRFIRDSNNQLFFSAASGWEISIKYSKGRLELPDPPDLYVANRLALHQFTPLPIQLTHTLHTYQLPNIHQDPFDRILISQCQLEKLPLITADASIQKYDVDIIW
ncbi:MAG: type II toxin-antitoxin system VapC family toxin [Chloroflexota bacterium]